MGRANTVELIVYLRAERCGRLRRADGLGYEFAYDPDWLDSRPNEQLSMSLPRQETRFDAAATRPFFFGLLPEGRRRERLESRYRLKEGDDFGLLAEIGGDCPGAVAVLPPDADPAALVPDEEPEPLDVEATELIASLRGEAVVDSVERRARRRLSIPGVQPKQGIWIAAGEDPATARILIPQGSAASTHILKPALNEEFVGIVWNEAFCTMLAGRLGLPVPRVAVRQLAGVDCLVIERFDRERRDGRTHRIHQEDFCQALGATEKYEEHGGPSLPQIGKLVRRLSVPAKDVALLLAALLFNYLIANADAHAKNFSLFHRAGGRREMTPLYDLVSTEVFPDISRDLAIFFGGHSDPDALTRSDFNKAAGELGVRPAAIEARASELAKEIIPEAMALRQDELFRGRGKLIMDAIRRRVGRISELYGLDIDHGAEPLVRDKPGGWIG
jgi:serine/threonine-protein kinase HipA